ncbi:PAS domain-containing sensor histidine kinase [Facilibium subflavum]|uniref:PAS domain-containing sensor histidine kinase n=1 Tax=Facilibium subflavum TaxID=2219058 RepID=UPI000E65977D|nr:PAS domain-containing sensor histidine kinase [Facilibium subflavum]
MHYIKTLEDLIPTVKHLEPVIPGNFYCLNLLHQVVYVNQSTVKATGARSKETLEGMSLFDLYPNDIAKNMINNQKKVIQTKNILIVEECIKDITTGENRFFDVTISPIFNDEGELIGTSGISIEITKRKELEIKTKQQKKELELKEQDKKEFVRSFLHDFNVPAQVMLANTHQLKTTVLSQDSEKLAAYAQGIEEVCLGLISMLNQLKDVLLNDRFQEKAYYSNFSFYQLLEHEIDLAKSLVKFTDGLILSDQLNKNLPNMVSSDFVKVTQIVRNLLSNAIKFTKKGIINIYVTLMNIDDFGYQVRVIIADTGIGIDQGDFERIFEFGTQLHSSYKTNFHGTGMGLHIVKANIDALGGKISVESKIYHGTRFIVDIPLRYPEDIDKSTPPPY